MKMFSFAMLTALLTLTFIACNHGNSHSDRSYATEMKAVDEQKPVAGNAESNKEISDMNMAADSSSISPLPEEDRQKEDRQTDTKQARNRPQSPGGAGGQQVAAANPDWDKKIVKTANLSLEVRNFKLFDGELNATVRRFGGYISQEQQTQSEYKIESSISIKVPVGQFDDAVNWLSNGTDSNKLVEKKISSDDVTMEVVDTKSRMESKREVLQRYMELLRQARTMNEILKVQHEINDVQEEIEGAQGRISYLGHASTFSTINLQYYQVLDVNATPTNTEPGFATRLRTSFSDGWHWARDIILELISLWPLWFGFALAWMGIRKMRRKIAANLKSTAVEEGASGSREHGVA